MIGCGRAAGVQGDPGSAKGFLGPDWSVSQRVCVAIISSNGGRSFEEHVSGPLKRPPRPSVKVGVVLSTNDDPLLCSFKTRT